MELKTYFAQDASGNIMPGATVTVYEAGTATLATGLQDESGSPLANPFTADSDAKVAFYAPDGLYDINVVSGIRNVTIRAQFVGTDAAIILRDDLAETSGAALVGADDGASGTLFTTVAGFISRLLSSAGSALVGFIQSGAGAVDRTLQAKLRDTVSVKDFGAVGDGVADDTAAIALAIASSAKRVFFPVGTYLCDEFVINFAGNSGRTIVGASTTDTVIKASASADEFFQVTGNYNRFNTFENFSIDMSLMANASTSRGIYLKQTWGNTFRNVNVINGGAAARELYLDVGTYTTVFDNCDFGSTTGIVHMQGVTLSGAVTTVTLIGCAFGQCIADQVVAITFLQPVVQGALNKFVLSNTSGFSILNGDIEGSGTYLVMGAAVGHLCSSNNELSGFSGTYSSGAFVGGYLMDQYGNTPYTLSPVAGTVHEGVVTEKSAGASLLRKTIQNTNAAAQNVDIEYKNAAGSAYIGLGADGTTSIQGVSSQRIAIKQGSTERLGIDAASRLVIGTLTQATVGTAGSASAPPAAPSGYARIVIGGADFVIPYYNQA